MHSLRRKEFFWQYNLGLFAPNGPNDRAADVELDMFVCSLTIALKILGNRMAGVSAG